MSLSQTVIEFDSYTEWIRIKQKKKKDCIRVKKWHILIMVTMKKRELAEKPADIYTPILWECAVSFFVRARPCFALWSFSLFRKTKLWKTNKPLRVVEDASAYSIKPPVPVIDPYRIQANHRLSGWSWFKTAFRWKDWRNWLIATAAHDLIYDKRQVRNYVCFLLLCLLFLYLWKWA